MEDDLRRELERLRAENQKLKKGDAHERPISLKVGAKGGLSVYGLGRFPVTLYKEQWEKLLNMTGEIRRFIDDNADKLKSRESVPPR